MFHVRFTFPTQRYKRSINIDSSPYGYDAEPTSPTGPSYESPFSFHPPSVADASQSAAAAGGALSTSPTVNPRKRPFPGSDGNDGSCRESGGIPPDYEYGSESRPQSRRLTVMELCNDTNPDAGTRSVLSGPGSRPTTSSGLAASASTLALVDRASRASSQLLGGTTSSAAGTSNDNGGKDNHGDIDNNGDIGNNGGNDNDKAADNARGTGAGWTRAEAGKGDKVRPIRMFF